MNVLLKVYQHMDKATHILHSVFAQEDGLCSTRSAGTYKKALFRRNMSAEVIDAFSAFF